MGRRGSRAIATLGLIGLAGTASAGDRALADFIGFSPDGRYFAFEEYGIQDGSGFPYSSIYLIDLVEDEWVEGSPHRVVLEADQDTQPDARRAAQQAAAAQLDALDIAAAADLIALAGDGEAGDGLRLNFGAPGYFPGELLSEHTLSLEMFEAGSSEPCVDYIGEPAKGFALSLTGEGLDRQLHRDGAMLPRSRGCPMTYRIFGVVTRPETGTIEGGVVIVSVYPFGFEGPDRRFLAVPLGP